MMYALKRSQKWKHLFFVSFVFNVLLVIYRWPRGPVKLAPYHGQPDKCPLFEPFQRDNTTDDRVRVAVLFGATALYVRFIPDVINSGKKNFLASPALKRAYNVTYIVFTNQVEKIKELPDSSNVIAVYKKPRGWPWDALFKYETYLASSKLLRHFDFVFAMDADMVFANEVGGEILGDLVGAIHPEHFNNSDIDSFPYERRVGKSCAAIPYGAGKDYYCSTIFGGRTANFLSMMCDLVQCTRDDFDPEQGRDLVARVEDESYLNRYFIDHPPSVMLSPAYIWQRWANSPFFPRIEAVPKDSNTYHVRLPYPKE